VAAPPPQPRSSRQRRIGWISLALGLIAVAGGGAVAGLCTNASTTCDVDAANCTFTGHCPYPGLTFLGLTAGLVLVVAALILLWGRPPEGRERPGDRAP
jgi:hypothetical protein